MLFDKNGEVISVNYLTNEKDQYFIDLANGFNPSEEEVKRSKENLQLIRLGIDSKQL